MPLLAGDVLRILVGVDRQNLGMPASWRVEPGGSPDSPNSRPNALCCSCVSVLVAEEDDEVLHQRVVHFLELLIAERPRQVDPADFGADMRRQLLTSIV